VLARYSGTTNDEVRVEIANRGDETTLSFVHVLGLDELRRPFSAMRGQFAPAHMCTAVRVMSDLGTPGRARETRGPNVYGPHLLADEAHEFRSRSFPAIPREYLLTLARSAATF
jgi:hypothetical protein